MTGESSTPWWYSGGDTETGPDESGPDAAEEGSRDWTSLVLGAQRIVDWATEKVMAPHAEHGDPRDHPDCVVCRTMAVLGEVGLRAPQSAEEEDDAAEDVPGAEIDADAHESKAGEIQWIPIRGEASAP